MLRKAVREDRLALPVAPVKADALAKDITERERCEYWIGEERCPRRKWQQRAKYCDMHESWQYTELALKGAPLPLNPMSLQVFLAKAVSEVISGNKSDVQVRAVLMLVKMMQRNAAWLFQKR